MNTLPLLSLAVASCFGDPALSRHIAHLDAPAFRDRERAASALRRAGPAAVPLLQRAAQHPSAEVRTRAAALVERWREERIRRLMQRWETCAWLDMLTPENFPQMKVPDLLRPVVLPLPGRETGGAVVMWYMSRTTVTGGDYAAYREATRLWVLDLLRAGHDPEAIDGLLRAMTALEPEWRRHYQSGGKPDF